MNQTMSSMSSLVIILSSSTVSVNAIDDGLSAGWNTAMLSTYLPYNCSYPSSENEATSCLENDGKILRYTSQEVKNALLGVQLLFTIVILGTNGVAIMLYIVDKSLRTPYNLHILSVLVADMCAGLFALPSAMLIHAPGMEGDRMCRAFAFFLSLIEAADVYTMVLIAAEKYLRLVHNPTIQRGIVRTGIYIALVWGSSLLYSMKEIFAYESYIETHWDGDKVIYHTECWIPPHRTVLSKTYVLFDALLLFCFPLLAICACYTSITRCLMKRSIHEAGIAQKKRAVHLHMTVVAMFFCTAGGLHILRLYLTFGGRVFPRDSLCNDILTTVAFSDFWINPLLYCFFNTNFRSSWIQLCRGKRVGNGSARVAPSPNDYALPSIGSTENNDSIKQDSVKVYTVA